MEEFTLKILRDELERIKQRYDRNLSFGLLLDAAKDKEMIELILKRLHAHEVSNVDRSDRTNRESCIGSSGDKLGR